jgi:hypothetical protein
MKFAPYIRNVAAFHPIRPPDSFFLVYNNCVHFPYQSAHLPLLPMNIILMKSIIYNYFSLFTPAGTTTARTSRRKRDLSSAKGVGAIGSPILLMRTIPLVFVVHSRYRGVIHQPAPAEAEQLFWQCSIPEKFVPDDRIHYDGVCRR